MNFNVGDFVTVVMSNNAVFAWQTSPRFGAEITYTPCDTGDLWQFKVLLVHGYVHLKINPCCAVFVGLEVHDSH